LVSQSFAASIVGRSASPSPLLLSSRTKLIAWHRADLGLTTGATLSLADQSGNGHTYSRTANQPTVEATGWQSTMQSILFDGTNDGLVCTTSLAADLVGGSDNSHTIVTVGQYVAVGAAVAAAMFGFGRSAVSANPFYFLQARGSGLAPASVFRIAKEDDAPLLVSVDSTENWTTAQTVYYITHSGTVVGMRRNGTALTLSGGGAQNVGATTVDRASIGLLIRNGAESNWGNIRWREQICYSSELTSGERDELTNYYLQPMYGLSA
jgi:hypothetical protein